MSIGPIQPNTPQRYASFSHEIPGNVESFDNGWQTTTSLPSSICPGNVPEEERAALFGRAVWRTQSFPGSLYPAGLITEGPFERESAKIVTYEEEPWLFSLGSTNPILLFVR